MRDGKFNPDVRFADQRDVRHKITRFRFHAQRPDHRNLVISLQLGPRLAGISRHLAMMIADLLLKQFDQERLPLGLATFELFLEHLLGELMQIIKADQLL